MKIKSEMLDLTAIA